MAERILTTEEVSNIRARVWQVYPYHPTPNEMEQLCDSVEALRAERDRLLAERERLVEFAWEHGRDERGYWEMTAAEVLAAFDAQQERT